MEKQKDFFETPPEEGEEEYFPKPEEIKAGLEISGEKVKKTIPPHQYKKERKQNLEMIKKAREELERKAKDKK